MPVRPTVIFDCNVFLQAVAREAGPAAAAFRLVEVGDVTLHISRPIIRELRAVLAYPTVRQSNPRITDENVGRFLDRVLYRCVYHRQVPHVFNYPRDPADERYLDLAIAVGADYLVTRDNNLLSLATDHTAIANDFRRRARNLSVVNPVAFVGSFPRRST